MGSRVMGFAIVLGCMLGLGSTASWAESGATAVLDDEALAEIDGGFVNFEDIAGNIDSQLFSAEDTAVNAIDSGVNLADSSLLSAESTVIGAIYNAEESFSWHWNNTE